MAQEATPSADDAPLAAPEAAPEAAAEAAPDQGPAFDIEAFDIEGNTLLTAIEVEAAVYPYMGPGRFGADVDKAREALEEAYRAKGYQSVVVEIPPQRADAGLVKLSVVEAPVGRLRVQGARYFSPEMIRRQAPSLVEGQTPNLTAAQAELSDINRLPDRRVTPVLKAGIVPGTIDIELKVSDTLPVHAVVEANNDHADGTTSTRTSATVRYTNLWQEGHSISATYLAAPERIEDAEVFAGSYLAPIWGTPWSLLVFGYNSNSNINTLGGASVLGKGYSIGARGIYQLPAWGPVSQTLTLGLDYKSFDEAITLGTPGTTPDESPIRYVPLTVAYGLQTGDENSTSNLTLSVTAGLRGIGSDAEDYAVKRAYSTGNFVHANLDIDHTRTLADGSVLLLRWSSQLADQPLASAEQFSAGGFSTVRGYLQSEAVGDNGVFASVEIRSPNLSPLLGERIGGLVEDWRFYGFLDGAMTRTIQPLPDQEAEFTLAGAGIGLRLQMLRYVYGDVVVGLPLIETLSSDQNEPRVTFSLKMEF